MDISFALHALAVEWLAREGAGLAPGVHAVPADLDREIARLKLAALGVGIDTLTDQQTSYRDTWS
jgi:adenosylhomocysteinase